MTIAKKLTPQAASDTERFANIFQRTKELEIVAISASAFIL